MTDVATQPQTDPLHMLTLREVVERTGIPRKTIYEWVAADELAKTPGRRFPRPLMGKKFRWHEASLVRWLERHAGEEAV
jgi:excisionase family DNA binding protein